MVSLPFHCPFFGSDDVGKNGHSNGKQRYLCRNHACSHQTFYAEYTYNGRKPEVKKSILKWAADGAGIRATSRCQLCDRSLRIEKKEESVATE